MSKHCNQNLLLFVTTTVLILMHLPIGNGIKYSSIMTPTPLDDLTVAEDDTENYSNDINKVILNDDFNLNDDDLLHVSKRYLTNNYDKLRYKRQVKKQYKSMFTVEVLVAVDDTMVKFHRDSVQAYILTLFSTVSDLFSDASIGNSISISVVDILFLGSDDVSAIRNASSIVTKMDIFCNRISKWGYHYDTAMLITRDEVCHNEQEPPCQGLGFSDSIGSVCQRSSCSIVQDNGLGAAFTIAHELGHILNMPHDDEEPCERHTMPHIMSSALDLHTHFWSWSNCSRDHISRLLERDSVSCLKHTMPTRYLQIWNNTLPGEIYSREHQCQLIPGNLPEFCPHKDECKELYCKTENSHGCRSNTKPVADGTPCNENFFWCQKGRCVPRVRRRVVDGGWGPWNKFKPCSLTCGGGVQESERECNSPVPVNGKYCKGKRKRYRSCNRQSCPPGSLEPREQLCSTKDGQDVGFKDIIDYRSAIWKPKYFRVGEDPDYQCLLHCHREGNNTHYRFQEIVPDGTACSVDSFDKCVNGNCKPAGCDNKLNSAAKLDKCGVCGGRNKTCVDYSGAFSVSEFYKMEPESGYHYVATIPTGASNILITTINTNSSGSHIALVDDENNYILNGHHSFSAVEDIHYAGVILHYLNVAPNPEYVKSTPSFKLKRALVIKVVKLVAKFFEPTELPNSVFNLQTYPFITDYRNWNNDTVLLNYSYTLNQMDEPSDIEARSGRYLYRWRMQQWKGCDSICKGNLHEEPVCVSTTNGLEVARMFCDVNKKPSSISKPCNMECRLSLQVSGSTECLAACGNVGERNITYICIKTLITGRYKREPVDLGHCLSKFGRLLPSKECREGCWTYTEWSACSKSCGAGYQTRKRMCVLDGNRVSDIVCNLKNVEVTKRVCNIKPC